MYIRKTKKKTVAEYPHLVEQWHPILNGDLKPKDVSFGSMKEIWFKCDVDEDHVWKTAICNRTSSKSGCPYCSGHKVCLSNCLAITHPYLIKQWHPTLNGILTPYDVSYGCDKKVWWVCFVAKDHIWQSKINTQTRGSGCPFCAGQKICLSNCLATKFPEITSQWHSTLNGYLKPENFIKGSECKIWWECSKGHVWEATINSRTSKNSGCPYCSGHKVCLSNCLATTHPHLIKQWHPTLNGNLTPYNVSHGSKIKIWWICDIDNNHVWEATVNSRTNTNGKGCPCCSGHKVALSNCLATLYPEIAEQWHPTLNGNLTPYDITAHGRGIIWWICSKGHIWKVIISNRTNGTGCPFCNESKGEKEVAYILNELNFKYVKQFKFKDCKNKQSLPFDFCITYNNKNYLIEFQGIQHYKPINFGSKNKSKEEIFKKIKERDNIKRKYCKENNIPLLEIPYTKVKNIKQLIIEFIK